MDGLVKIVKGEIVGKYIIVDWKVKHLNII
jgi:hypothetical protein